VCQRMWHVVRCLCNLSIFVGKLKIRWSLSRKHTLGTLNFHQSVPRPAPPTSLPPSEAVRVELGRVTYAKESAPGAPLWVKMAEVPALMRAAGANMSPCANGGRTNGADLWPEDAPDRATLTPRTSKGHGFSPSREAAFYDVTSIPRSFDIVDLGTRAAGIAPSVTSSHQLGARGGGCGVDMFMGRDRAPTAKGHADYGWSGCSTTDPGESLDGWKKLLYLIFPGRQSATCHPPFSDSTCSA
jgi:hypothetical protein